MYVHMNSQDVEDGDRRLQDSPASCSCSELALRQETHKAAFPSAGPPCHPDSMQHRKAQADTDFHTRPDRLFVRLQLKHDMQPRLGGNKH